jgi:hypothetical protein
MNMQHSRRSILGRLAGAMASTPVAVEALSPVPGEGSASLYDFATKVVKTSSTMVNKSIIIIQPVAIF